MIHIGFDPRAVPINHVLVAPASLSGGVRVPHGWRLLSQGETVGPGDRLLSSWRRFWQLADPGEDYDEASHVFFCAIRQRSTNARD